MMKCCIASFGVCLVALLLCSSALGVQLQVEELLHRQANSKSKIITFSTEDWEEFAVSPDRPYHLAVFLGASHAMDSPKTQLRKLHEEFALRHRSAFARGPDNGKIFFVDMWHDKSGALFAKMGTTTVPFAFRWSSTIAPRSAGKIVIPEDDRLGKGIQTYPWPAESVVSFLAGRTGLTAGEVDRPSFFKSPAFPPVALFTLLALAYVGWKLYNAPFMRFTGLYALGSLLVFWFSASGGMYNIIRGMPLYTYQNKKVVWWMPGRQGQLGAEGFVMGSSYIFFSMTLAGLIYGVPKVQNSQLRQLISWVAVVTAAAVVWQIFAAWQDKTGFNSRTFFF